MEKPEATLRDGSRGSGVLRVHGVALEVLSSLGSSGVRWSILVFVCCAFTSGDWTYRLVLLFACSLASLLACLIVRVLIWVIILGPPNEL